LLIRNQQVGGSIPLAGSIDATHIKLMIQLITLFLIIKATVFSNFSFLLDIDVSPMLDSG